MNNFWQRTLTGILFIAVMAGGILWSETSLTTLMAVISLLCFYEFISITSPPELRMNNLLWGLLPAVFLQAILITNYYLPGMSSYLPLVLPLVFISFLPRLFGREEKPFEPIMYALGGLFYTVIPFLLIAMLPWAIEDQSRDDEYRKYALAFFVLVWANDTFAYVTGRLIGKTPLFERISPKKTIEGTAGGAILTMVAGWSAHYYLPELSALEWIITALIVSVFATLGDLVESMLKRSYGIKDSGNMLPGHGGLLDRFDGAILAAPFVFTYWLMLRI